MFYRHLQAAKPLLALQLIAATLTGSLVQAFWSLPTQAQTTAYCHLSSEATQQKETLLQASLKGNKEAEKQYKTVLVQQADKLQECRSRTWPQTQAIWLRLYPCDIRPGAMEDIMDRIVNRGYNQVYVEVFYDGQVLLPAAANPTVWPAVIRVPGAENVDLLAQAIQKGHERGLKVYAWMFTMNFGYSYVQRSDRQSVIARDGKGQTSLYVVDNASQTFIDPYNIQAKRDYYQLVQEVVRRRPDGVLFDYVRYPRESGSNSIATKVQDLWIYGEAAQIALFRRALNYKGLDLIRRFLTKGYITAEDVSDVDKLYPQEGEPLWQGRTPPPPPPPPSPSLQPSSTGIDGQLSPSPQLSPTALERQPILQWDLWRLSVAHAMQGVLDFLAMAAWPVQQQGIPAGAVFFPEGNQAVGEGYDSRLQPWDRFPSSLEWHPMSYANCGSTSCVVAEVQRVAQAAPPGVQIMPAIAGLWGKSIGQRPSLEAQMQAIHEAVPQVRSISHFAFSWQEPDLDNQRKFCQLR